MAFYDGNIIHFIRVQSVFHPWLNKFLWLFCLVCSSTSQTVFAQADRQALLERKPLVEVDVQPLNLLREEMYPAPNPLVLPQQPEAENPLSFYARTQDGEWQIPAQVDRKDPWVRLLLLGPVRPTIIEVAIEINQRPFRAARELRIDQLLTEAKAASTASQESTKKSTETSAHVLTKDAISENQPTVENDVAEDVDVEGDIAEIPMVAAQSRQARSVLKRLIHYLTADPSGTDREELRWLLAEWTGGPALLTLSPAFAWRRAEVAPLWHALDRDGNQTLSRDEMQQTTAMFQRADANRDDTVDLLELQRILESQKIDRQRFRDEQTTTLPTKGHPLVLVIDESTDWKTLRTDLRNAYPQQGQTTSKMSLQERLGHGDRSLGIADLASLLSVPADVVVRVSFATQENVKKDLFALLKISDATDDHWRISTSAKQTIVVAYQGTQRQEVLLELSAAQGKMDSENTRGAMQQTQIALGAVMDGYPLFRRLDHDNNQQLSLREQRRAQALLKSLDRNQDGQLDRAEKPVAMRLAITHGPQVHQHLAQPVAAQRDRSNLAEVKAPAWFAGMDRNRDGDLSKREFQGNPAQFAKFDQNKDGLISRQEVQ